jgi:copper chaperone CopZ
MKNVFSFILAAGLIFGLSSCNQTTSESGQETLATTTVSMSVEGMVCASGCAGKIEKTLNETEGVTLAEVNFEEGSCVVEYDESVITQEEIVAVVSDVNGGAYSVALTSNETSSNAHKGCSAEERAACKKQCSPEEIKACKEEGTCSKECTPEEKKACQDKAAKDGVTKEA